MTGGPDSSFDPNKKAEKWLFINRLMNIHSFSMINWAFWVTLRMAFRFTEAFHQILTISAFIVFSKNFARNYVLIFDSSTFAGP